MSGSRLRRFVPAALVFAALPLSEVGGAAVGLCGLHPVAFLAVLLGTAVAVGAAEGWGVRPTIAKAAAGKFPLPITANRLRTATALAACGTAALAAALLSYEVRGRWNMKVIDDISHHPVIPGAIFIPLMNEQKRPDTYIRGVVADAGLPLPDWVTRAVYHGFPLSAGLLAGTVAWRRSNPERLSRTVRSGLDTEEAR